MPDVVLLPLFKTVETANKNDKSKHGNVKLASKYIDIALLDMDRWIDKGKTLYRTTLKITAGAFPRFEAGPQ